MDEIKHDGYETYNKHESGQMFLKKRHSFSLHCHEGSPFSIGHIDHLFSLGWALSP